MDWNDMDMWTTSPFEQKAQEPATSPEGVKEYDYEIINRMLAGSATMKQLKPTWALNPADDDAELISKMIMGSKNRNVNELAFADIIKANHWSEPPVLASSKAEYFLCGLMRRKGKVTHSGKSQC